MSWKVALACLLVLVAVTLARGEDRETRPGMAIDPRGLAVIDPTKNVEDNIRNSERRQDDLRKAAADLFEARLTAIAKVGEMRSQFDKELLKAATDRLDSEARLRAEFFTAINATEKERVNAIRTVDTGAVTIANERAIATANAIAKTVQDTAQVQSTATARAAEDLRALVATTAAETNRNIQQQFTAIGLRVSALEASRDEGKGKAGVSDPALIELVREVRRQSDALSTTKGQSEGVAWLWALAAGILGLLIGLGGLFLRYTAQQKTA